jgi:ATP-binding cassette subfamily B protein
VNKAVTYEASDGLRLEGRPAGVETVIRNESREGGLNGSTSESSAGSPAAIDYLASLRLLLRHSGGVRLALLFSMSLATASVFFDLVPIWVIWQLTVSVIDGTASMTSVAIYAAIALVSVLLGHGTLAAAMMQSHVAAFGIVHNLRLAISGRLVTLPLGWFDRRGSGEVKKLVIDEPEQLEIIAAHAIPEGAGAFTTWLAVTFWLFATDWRMALACVCLTPLSFALIGFAMSRSAPKVREYQRASERLNGSIVEYLTGMPVLKIFNLTGQSFAGTADAVRNYTRIETDMGRAFVPFGGVFHALLMANITVILPAGLWLLTAGAIDVATLIFFIILGANYSQPLVRLFGLFRQLAHISVASTLIQDVLDTPQQPDTGKRVNLPNHDIAFDNVRFGYGNYDVLHDICLTAKAGTITALVGPSGSGKSTIAKLAARFHDPCAGRITIGGVDIRQISVAQLMETVAFVFQDTFLFSDSVAANIRMGRPDATDAEVRAAASAARAHDFISALPEGYQSIIGEKGAALSGGERQRIAIARAILKDAPVIILDEATAFADPDCEAAIQQAVGVLARGKTLIVVAHRLHTITSADQILLVKTGRIVETGRHEELLQRRGCYARLWEDHIVAQSIVLRQTETTLLERTR